MTTDQRDRFAVEDLWVDSVSVTPVNADWQTQAREQVDEQRRVAKIAQRERKRLQTAIRAAQGLPGDVPAAVQDARGLMDVEHVIAAWRPRVR